MIMTPGVRKFALIAHVVSSVGWLGSIAAFLVLSIAGLTSRNAEIVRGAYLAMNLVGQFAIVPLSLLAVLTGVVQGLGTHWGLFRYYWVLTKFTLTIVATLLLILHQFKAVAVAAARVSVAARDTMPNVGRLGSQLVFDASAALLVLLVTTTLSVYKPWGLIERAQPASDQTVLSDATDDSRPLPVGLRIFLAVLGMIVAAVLIVHIAGGGMKHH